MIKEYKTEERKIAMAMSLEKREKISQERRSAILDAAISLFDDKGYVNTTISDIARQADMSNGLIYHYFSSKEDILRSYGQSIKECEEHVMSQPTGTDSLREFCRRVLLDYEVTQYHSPIRILITCYGQGEVKEDDLGFPFNDYGKTFLAAIIKKGQDAGEFRRGDPAILGDILWHTIIGYTIHRMNYGKDKISIPDIELLLDTVR
ncbi:MAG: TetR/AcrR family transcriptional regulator [Blautia sp.]|nr:TetR/AcrR family transcriptional regulator [Blautia sp.]